MEDGIVVVVGGMVDMSMFGCWCDGSGGCIV